jgi:hypothetical protein
LRNTIAPQKCPLWLQTMPFLNRLDKRTLAERKCSESDSCANGPAIPAANAADHLRAEYVSNL